MAIMCLEYLTFDCFDASIRLSDDDILEGCLAFQDYAIAKWFHHVNAFVHSGPSFLRDAPDLDFYLKQLSGTLENFTSRFDEQWDSKIVGDCKKSCEAFEQYNLYDNLLFLTSHIYIHQHQKGFDARHKISIKGLEEALKRNRDQLEKLTGSHLSPGDLARHRRFYDDQRYFKCNQITCRFFSKGFGNARDREKHVKAHTRPHHCEVPACLGADGFARQQDLDKYVIDDYEFGTTYLTI